METYYQEHRELTTQKGNAVGMAEQLGKGCGGSERAFRKQNTKGEEREGSGDNF